MQTLKDAAPEFGRILSGNFWIYPIYKDVTNPNCWYTRRRFSSWSKKPKQEKPIKEKKRVQLKFGLISALKSVTDSKQQAKQEQPRFKFLSQLEVAYPSSQVFSDQRHQQAGWRQPRAPLQHKVYLHQTHLTEEASQSQRVHADIHTLQGENKEKMKNK